MDFLEAMNFRHACKLFDESKKVDKETILKIIEFGRLSPSSNGLEPWHFLVISNDDLKLKMKSACWNQAQITSSCFLVVYLSYLPHNFRQDADFLNQRYGRKQLTSESYKMIMSKVSSFLTEQNTLDWVKKQGFIPLANMMTGAATLGIDSCPMEGFESRKLKEILKDYADFNNFDISVLCTFGYRVNPQPTKIRESIESIATYIE